MKQVNLRVQVFWRVWKFFWLFIWRNQSYVCLYLCNTEIQLGLFSPQAARKSDFSVNHCGNGASLSSKHWSGTPRLMGKRWRQSAVLVTVYLCIQQNICEDRNVALLTFSPDCNTKPWLQLLLLHSPPILLLFTINFDFNIPLSHVLLPCVHLVCSLPQQSHTYIAITQ